MNKSLVLVMCDVLVLTLLSLTSFERNTVSGDDDSSDEQTRGGGSTTNYPPITLVYTNIVYTNIVYTNIVYTNIVDQYAGPRISWDDYAGLTNAYKREQDARDRRERISRSVCEVFVTYENLKCNKYFAPVVCIGEDCYALGRFAYGELEKIASVSVLVGADQQHVKAVSASYLQLEKDDNVVLFKLAKSIDGVGLSLGQRMPPNGSVYRVSSRASAHANAVSVVHPLPKGDNMLWEALHTYCSLEDGDVVVSEDSAAVVMFCLPGSNIKKKVVSFVGRQVVVCPDPKYNVNFEN